MTVNNKLLLVAAALAQGALSSPLQQRQACAASWAQCGGINHNGPTCCVSGTFCSVVNDYYHQCLPGSNPPGSTTVPTTSQPPPTTAPTSQPQPTTTTGGNVPSTTITGGAGTTASYTGNPFAGVNLLANHFYSSEVHEMAIPTLSPALAAKASKVAEVPSFLWMDKISKVDTVFKTELERLRAANKAGGNYAGQFVVYDLPDRDCAAAASNGEFSIANGGVAKYKEYIDKIRAHLIAYSDIRSILVIEPDSLANMVTNLNVAKCQNAQAAYLECTHYAVEKLNLPNVAMYMDAGHAGWLGWPANLQPAADLFAKFYRDAGKPKTLRGLVTNVSNYNGWSLASAPSYATSNPNFDEKHFVQAIAPLLRNGGWEDVHFITDQGRSGKQPTGQIEWGHWCNAKSTGFGTRPTTNTGLDIQDAFVWVKPGGESDGTSDTTATRYDHFCGSESSFKPAPEAGEWFPAFFEMLLNNANPTF